MKIDSYNKLIVWQKSIELVTEIYTLTNKFPTSELYGLTSQMRRSAISIPSNIAEGRRRGTRKDFRSFLLNTYGSGAELETHIEIAKRLPFGEKLNYQKIENLLDEIMRMLNRMIFNLQSSPSTSYQLPATSSSKGFSLLELIISLAIIALLGTVAGLTLVNYQRSMAADSTAREIVGQLRLAQRKAVSGEDGDLNGQGDSWGIRFSNSSDDTYQVFYGTVYNSASTTATVYLPSSAVFTNPTAGTSTDIIFTKLSGTTTPATISITLPDGSDSRTITIATSTISMQ